MNITILLVEDDFLNRRLTRKLLADSGYEVLEAKNTREALEVLSNNKTDLLLLDINLGEGEQDGISLALYVKEKYSVPFIFLTAYETGDVISRAVSTFPLSYLTKPFKNADLIASVELGLRKSSDEEQNQPFIVVKEEEYSVKVPLSRIDYIESQGNYLLVHSNHKVYKCRSTIRRMLEALPETGFIQTHRAYIVNKDKIDMFSPQSLIIKNVTVPVSKNYISDIQAIYKIRDSEEEGC